MKTMNIPTIPSTEFGGGFYAGRLFIANEPHALIVAPKAEGEIAPIAWNRSLKSVEGATSYCDGLANTKAMADAGSDLAKQILALRIGGFDDWHLPSRLQLLVAYHELATTTAVAVAFAEGGSEAFARNWYWSSTQHAAGPDYAWFQYFGYGGQYDHRKDVKLRARAVRTIKL